MSIESIGIYSPYVILNLTSGIICDVNAPEPNVAGAPLANV
jgi:hypothetical protein